MSPTVRPLHGANVLISIGDAYLIIHQQRGGLALPGGGIEGSELPHQAAIRETLEEIGGILNPEDLTLAATCAQRVPTAPAPYRHGFLWLYVAKNLRVPATDGSLVLVTAENLGLLCLQEAEVSQIELLDVSTLLERNGEFGLGYKRLTLIGHKFNLRGQYREYSLAEPVSFGDVEY